MRRAHVVAVTAMVLLGCAQPEPTPTAQPDRDAALAPTVVEEEPSPVPVTPSPSAPEPDGSARRASPSAPAAPEPTRADEGEPSATEDRATTGDAAEQPPPPARVVVLGVPDAGGDHGLEGPAWVDLVSLEFVDVGNDLEVTLRFAAELPSAPPEGEVPLIGVDILEQENGESAYQLFVDGGGQEWGAHLQTPQGFVPFPGTFVIGGRAMTLTLPWNALGSPTRGPVRAYVEWSRESLLINPQSRDTLDGQPHTFDRNP